MHVVILTLLTAINCFGKGTDGKLLEGEEDADIELQNKNLRLKQSNSLLLKTLKELTAESAVGFDCAGGWDGSQGHRYCKSLNLGVDACVGGKCVKETSVGGSVCDKADGCRGCRTFSSDWGSTWTDLIDFMADSKQCHFDADWNSCIIGNNMCSGPGGDCWEHSSDGVDLAPGEWSGDGQTSFEQCTKDAESSGVKYFAWTGQVYNGYCKVLNSDVTSPDLTRNQGYGYQLYEYKCTETSVGGSVCNKADWCRGCRTFSSDWGSTWTPLIDFMADSKQCHFDTDWNSCTIGDNMCSGPGGDCTDIKMDVDFSGNDIHFVYDVVSAEFCAEECANYDGCTHWSWGKKPGQSYTNKCHLKSGTDPVETPNDCCDSGFKNACQDVSHDDESDSSDDELFESAVGGHSGGPAERKF